MVQAKQLQAPYYDVFATKITHSRGVDRKFLEAAVLLNENMTIMTRIDYKVIIMVVSIFCLLFHLP